MRKDSGHKYPDKKQRMAYLDKEIKERRERITFLESRIVVDQREVVIKLGEMYEMLKEFLSL